MRTMVRTAAARPAKVGRHIAVAMIVLLSVSAACGTEASWTEDQEAATEDVIRQATVAFLEAYDSLEPDNFLARFSDDMTWGARGGFESASEFSDGVRSYMATLVESENVWDEISVRVLAPDVAVSEGIGHEREVSSGGNVLEDSYAISLIWARVAGEWRVVHAHSSHPPAPDAG